MKSAWSAILLFGLLVAIGSVGRLVPHAPNFTPIAAVTLFAVFAFRRRWVAPLVALSAMALADLSLGWRDARVHLVVYASLASLVALRPLLRGRLMPLRIAGGALSAAAVFFVATNAAVWLWSGMYAFSAGGFVACFAAALPFFKNTLAANLVWSGLLFGGYALARGYASSARTRSLVSSNSGSSREIDWKSLSASSHSPEASRAHASW